MQGDDLIDRAASLGIGGSPLTANAYLGAFGVAAALSHGADVVVTGRVTDASVVVGPAVARFGWTPTSYDELAGASVAGHVIECGAQATGGNFSGFSASTSPLGFPLAEIAADGSSVITKHPGTGGQVTVDTVTAQLVYEIQSATYLGPDVSTHLDSIVLASDGPDRVRVSGVVGSPPPETLKVCVNELGGFRNQAELVLVGLDIEEKAAWVRAQVDAALAADPPAAVEWSLARTDHQDADTEEAASSRLRICVRDPDADKVGRAFTAPLVELALASYPGFTLTGPPAPATPYGVYRPAYVPRSAVHEQVVLPDGRTLDVPPPRPPFRRPVTQAAVFAACRCRSDGSGGGLDRLDRPGSAGAVRARGPRSGGLAVRAPEAAGAVRAGGARPQRRQGRRREHRGVGARRGRPPRPGDVAAGVPDPRDRAGGCCRRPSRSTSRVVALPNLGGVNVLLPGLLGEGVAASSRFDPQAKALGEWLRSRHVDVPEELL